MNATASTSCNYEPYSLCKALKGYNIHNEECKTCSNRLRCVTGNADNNILTVDHFRKMYQLFKDQDIIIPQHSDTIFKLQN